jgi:hypothetical protein
MLIWLLFSLAAFSSTPTLVFIFSLYIYLLSFHFYFMYYFTLFNRTVNISAQDERGTDESAKAYHYMAMLAILKPWRDYGQLKDEGDTWESAFTAYMQNASK